MYDYFYPETAHNFSFYKIPKMMFLDPQFDGLTSDAKLLYGVMRDRIELSQKNGWVDECGRVFIIFKGVEIAEIFRWGEYKITKHLKELDKANIIERVRMYNGLPDRIYVKNIHPFERSPQNQDVSRNLGNQDTGSLEIKTPVPWKSGNRFRENQGTGSVKIKAPVPWKSRDILRNRETENQTNTKDTEREIKALTQNLSVIEKNLFFDFLKTRSNLTQEQVRLLLVQLLSVGKIETERIAILEKTIRKGWKDFYPLDDGAPRALPQPIEKQNFEGVTYSSEFLSSLEVDYDAFIASLEGGK